MCAYLVYISVCLCVCTSVSVCVHICVSLCVCVSECVSVCVHRKHRVRNEAGVIYLNTHFSPLIPGLVPGERAQGHRVCKQEAGD